MVHSPCVLSFTLVIALCSSRFHVLTWDLSGCVYSLCSLSSCMIVSGLRSFVFMFICFSFSMFYAFFEFCLLFWYALFAPLCFCPCSLIPSVPCFEPMSIWSCLTAFVCSSVCFLQSLLFHFAFVLAP